MVSENGERVSSHSTGCNVQHSRMELSRDAVHYGNHQHKSLRGGEGGCKRTRFKCAVDSRRRHENKADKWAVRHLVPVADLDDAVAEGCTELWELAERFGVTESFMRKAVCYYVHGNLATELYF